MIIKDDLNSKLFASKEEFEMKDLEKKNLSRLANCAFSYWIFSYQSIYMKKILNCFYMDTSHSLSSLMVVRSLDVKNDPSCLCEKDEKLPGSRVLYLNAMGMLIYLANYTHLDIDFYINLIAKYSSILT